MGVGRGWLVGRRAINLWWPDIMMTLMQHLSRPRAGLLSARGVVMNALHVNFKTFPFLY